MKKLIHICCAGCFCAVREELQADGSELVGLFYNPNVHPLLEFRRRLKAVRLVQQRYRMETVYEEEYGLWRFLEEVYGKAGDRCERCYRMRLMHTALLARERQIPCFTTTLLVSQHQKHELVKDVGKEVAEETGVAFAYNDMRHLAPRGAELARRFMLYRQAYCGCVFSEYERFKDTKQHLWRGE